MKLLPMAKKTKPQLSPEETVLRRSLFCVVVVLGLVGILWQFSSLGSHATASDSLTRAIRQDIYHDFQDLSPKIKVLEDAQTKTGVRVVSDEEIQAEISPINFYAARGDERQARQALMKLSQNIGTWQSQYDSQLKAKAVAAAVTPPPAAIAVPTGAVQVPILLYHYTPGNFEAQLQYLKAHNYTSIDLDTLVAGLNHQATLPSKPVVITFDDGYSNQMAAFSLLKKYNMKATYYIIDGGAASNWCIGTNRNYSLNCGDGYLNVDQLRELDSSGIITLASHTVDHSNLPTLSIEQQRFEIIDGKHQLEAELGHSVHHFAYPYGSYNATTIQIVKEAGFTTAVSTIPGTLQSLGNLYSLYRVRDALKLP
jgi:peptidoglycan/xylan/chitin deacetylase (PgdA/CDA1 family)